jgi:class 3 adenylate cyclase
MFTDFKDFTIISEGMDPTQLVDEIDYYFAAFDDVMEKYGLEKIKTIGDSYMCVGGLPEESDDHAVKIIQAAIEIRELMWNSKTAKEAEGSPHFAIRFGIHTGPVVAGVVGSKKFAYDIWGDTVNTASRIETNCEPWEINVSGATHEITKEFFEFDHRGKVSVKSKGEIDMYYLLQNHDQK